MGGEEAGGCEYGFEVGNEERQRVRQGGYAVLSFSFEVR